MIKDVIIDILAFRDERDWKQYHNPKDLAISIVLEAGELLENFQWSSWQESVKKRKEKISDELADVFMYCILMSDALDFDIDKIIRKKLEKNKIKYPPDKAYGKKEKYTEYK